MMVRGSDDGKFDNLNAEKGDVTELSSRAIDTEALNIDEIWSSWGDIYPATDSGISTAITDLNAEGFGEWIQVPPGDFTTDTAWVATSSKGVVCPAGKSAATIRAGSGLSSRLVDIQGGHLSRGVNWNAQGNVPVTMEVTTTSVSNVRHEHTRAEGSSGPWNLDLGADADNRDNFNWTLIASEYKGARFKDAYWLNSYNCAYLAPDGSTTGSHAVRTYSMQACNFLGGAMSCGVAQTSILRAHGFHDSTHYQGIAFEGDAPLHVEWRTDGSSRMRGSTAMFNRHLNGGTESNIGYDINAMTACAFGFNAFVGGGGFATGMDVAPGNAKFETGTFFQFDPRSVNTNAYNGFASAPRADDAVLVGGGGWVTR